MDLDMKYKRADFISKSAEVRDCFSFAQPNQVLQAVYLLLYYVWWYDLATVQPQGY